MNWTAMFVAATLCVFFAWVGLILSIPTSPAWMTWGSFAVFSVMATILAGRIKP